jgi:hypothetical protein
MNSHPYPSEAIILNEQEQQPATNHRDIDSVEVTESFWQRVLLFRVGAFAL